MMSTGVLFSVLDVLAVSKKSFLKAENLIGDKWKETLTEEMILAGKAEREAALAEGKLDEGIPTIDVVVDGGWSTRSHQHSYTAN